MGRKRAGWSATHHSVRATIAGGAPIPKDEPLPAQGWWGKWWNCVVRLVKNERYFFYRRMLV